MKHVLAVTVISVMLFAPVQRLYAETARGGGDQDIMARAQQMLRKMAEERDALESKNAKLQDQVDALKKETAGLKGESAKMKKNLTASSNEIIHYKEKYKVLLDRLIQTRTKFQEVIDKFRQTINTLRQVEMERNQLKVTLQDRTREVESCIKKNIQLYQLDLVLVKQYKNKGVFAALLQKEPVTGLKKVDIENAVQAYQTRLEQLRSASPPQQTSSN